MQGMLLNMALEVDLSMTSPVGFVYLSNCHSMDMGH